MCFSPPVYCGFLQSSWALTSSLGTHLGTLYSYPHNVVGSVKFEPRRYLVIAQSRGSGAFSFYWDSMKNDIPPFEHKNTPAFMAVVFSCLPQKEFPAWNCRIP